MGKLIWLNDSWEFTKRFTEDLLKETNGEALQSVRLPHSCVEMPLHYFDESIYQMLCGYRRILNAPAEWEGKRVLLTFEGVAHSAVVFLNGEKVATHACGYTAFTVELTGKLRIGGQNILVVRVDSRENQNIPPFGYVVDYMTYGGIYRDVYLQIFEEEYLEDVFVTTSQKNIHRIKSYVKVNVGAKEKEKKDQNLVIRQSIRRKDTGEYVRLGEIAVDDIRMQTGFVVDGLEGLGRIELWDVDHPVLYQLKTELIGDGDVLDEREDIFGFRRMHFRADGFYLNGKKLKIRGLNRHQSYPYIGYAATKSLQQMDADILKNELGVNAVRTSHYPQSRYFLDRCDELGLLVFTEIPGWQYIGDDKWKKKAIQNVADMIRQNRNHPSIMIWGVRINESIDDDGFYLRTNQLAHKLDPTRQTGGVRAIKKSHLLEDVYTYNDFVHEGDNKGCEPKKYVTSDRNKAYLITEHNGHMFPTKAYDCEIHRVSQALRHAKVLDSVAEQDDIAGCFGWCMFDYHTHKDFGSGDRICYHGVMDMFRNPKTAAAVYASQQDAKPVLVPGSSMDIGEHPGGNRGHIYLFTNADSVRMYKNEELLHEYFCTDTKYKHMPHGPIMVDDFVGKFLETKEHIKPAKAQKIKRVFNAATVNGLRHIPLDAKMAAAQLIAINHMNYEQAAKLYTKYVGDWGGSATAYRFEAIKDGRVVCSVKRQPMHERILKCKTDHVKLCEENSYDMAAIRIQMQDESGNTLSCYNDPVTFETTGEIELVGPGIASFQGGMTGTYVRTVGRSGSGKLTITAGSCKAELVFEIEVRGCGLETFD